MDDYSVLENLYHERFGDWFPNMSFMTDSDEELMLKMKECLEKGVPAKNLYNLSYADEIRY